MKNNGDNDDNINDKNENNIIENDDGNKKINENKKKLIKENENKEGIYIYNLCIYSQNVHIQTIYIICRRFFKIIK